MQWCWEVLHNYRKSVHTVEVAFGLVKLKMTYLFVLETAPENIIPAIQQYYIDNRVNPTRPEESTHQSHIEESVLLFSETHEISELNAPGNYLYPSPSKDSQGSFSIFRGPSDSPTFRSFDPEGSPQNKAKVKRSISEM